MPWKYFGVFILFLSASTVESMLHLARNNKLTLLSILSGCRYRMRVGMLSGVKSEVPIGIPSQPTAALPWANSFLLKFFRYGGARKVYWKEMSLSGSPIDIETLSKNVLEPAKPGLGDPIGDRKATLSSLNTDQSSMLRVLVVSDGSWVWNRSLIEAEFRDKSIQLSHLTMNYGLPYQHQHGASLESHDGEERLGPDELMRQVEILTKNSYDAIILLPLVVSGMGITTTKTVTAPPSSSSSSSSSSSNDIDKRVGVASADHIMLENRVNFVRKLRGLLRDPGYAGHPHRAGLLLLIEWDAVFGPTRKKRMAGESKHDVASRLDLLSDWKHVLRSCHFDLIRHTEVVHGSQIIDDVGLSCIGFALKTSATGCDAQQPLSYITDPAQAEGNSRIRDGLLAVPTFRVSSEFSQILTAKLSEVARHTPQQSWEIHDVSSISPASGGDRHHQIAPKQVSHTSHGGGGSVSKSSSHHLPVAIVGGGLAGGALALALQQKGIACKVFERDASFDTRKQGYALTIQQGFVALRMWGLADIVNNIGVTSRAHISLNSRGNLLGAYGVRAENPSHALARRVGRMPVIPVESRAEQLDLNHIHRVDSRNTNTDFEGKPFHRRHNVHIPRQVLRNIIYSQLQPNTVVWDKKLSRFSDHLDRVTLNFADGSDFTGSALVAADGINSIVRSHIVDVHAPSQPGRAYSSPGLRYLGLMVVLGISPIILRCDYENFVDPAYPAGSIDTASPYNPGIDTMLPHQIIRRSIQWLDGETRIFTMPFDRQHTMWQLSFPIAESEGLQLMKCDQLLRRVAIDRVSDWDPAVVRLVTSSREGSISGHPAYDRDLFDPAEMLARGSMLPSSLVTFIGDAAHPMSPFKGQGANQALLDASSLCSTLARSELASPIEASTRVLSSTLSVAEALRSYENEMSQRSSSKVLKSRAAASILHSPAALSVGDVSRASAATLQSADE